MKKEHKKVIKELANILPKQMYEFKGRIKCIGSDVLLANTKEIDGIEVDPEKEYILTMPFRNEVNHYLRIKRAFKNHGRAGVIKYCRPFINPEHFGKFQVSIFNVLS